jgi:hypothetical protein
LCENEKVFNWESDLERATQLARSATRTSGAENSSLLSRVVDPPFGPPERVTDYVLMEIRRGLKKGIRNHPDAARGQAGWEGMPKKITLVEI